MLGKEKHRYFLCRILVCSDPRSRSVFQGFVERPGESGAPRLRRSKLTLRGGPMRKPGVASESPLRNCGMTGGGYPKLWSCRLICHCDSLCLCISCIHIQLVVDVFPVHFKIFIPQGWKRPILPSTDAGSGAIAHPTPLSHRGTDSTGV